MTATKDVQPHIKIKQSGRTGTPGANGEISRLLTDSQATWQHSTPSYSYPPWRDYKQDPPQSDARLTAAPQSSRTKPLTAFSSTHHTPSGKRKKPAKSSWQRPQSDQAHHSWSANPVQKGHIKVSLKDGTQRDWVNKVRFALNSKQRMRAACELTDAEKLQPCHASRLMKHNSSPSMSPAGKSVVSFQKTWLVLPQTSSQAHACWTTLTSRRLRCSICAPPI